MSENIHIRQIVKYTDYKRFRTTTRILNDAEVVEDGKKPDKQK
jgi:hypothetical protein